MEDYEKYKASKFIHPKKRKPKELVESLGEQQPKKLKQITLNLRTNRSVNEQAQADHLISDFIVQTMSPQVLVEHKGFINLIEGMI